MGGGDEWLAKGRQTLARAAGEWKEEGDERRQRKERDVRQGVAEGT